MKRIKDRTVQPQIRDLVIPDSNSMQILCPTLKALLLQTYEYVMGLQSTFPHYVWGAHPESVQLWTDSGC